MLAWLSLSLAALGHGCLTVLAINVFHGVGIRESRMRWAKPLFLAVLGGWSVALVAFAWTGAWADWPWPIRAYAAVCILTAGAGLPIVTAMRAFRKPPPGASGRSRILDLAEGRDRRELIGRGPDSWWLRLPGNQAFEFEMSEWEVPMPRLPRGLDGLSILHLSDLHLTPAYSRAFFDSLFDIIEPSDADLVLFTGDLIDDEEHLDWVKPLLSRVRGRLGQFGILGNHDYRHDIGRALAALAESGFEPLEARWRVIEHDGQSLAIGGTSAPWGEPPPPIPAADFSILLSHTPDRFGQAAEAGTDLVLSGHTHGGQYRLPVIGPILMPSVYSRRYDGGFFRRGSTLMYVSRGIAGQHPLRFNCRPEVARLALRAVDARTERPAAVGARFRSARTASPARPW